MLRGLIIGSFVVASAVVGYNLTDWFGPAGLLLCLPVGLTLGVVGVLVADRICGRY